MNLIKSTAFYLLLLSLSSCHPNIHNNEILLKLTKSNDTDPQYLKIVVLAEDIIHVMAATTENFSQKKSLMAIEREWDEVDFRISEKGDIITLSTPKLRLDINKITGSTAYYDKSGKLLLKEKGPSAKIFTPAIVMDEETYHVQQIFESQEHEAIYGLGAHQNGIMNYRGNDVDLWQYNIVNAVPLLVSNKNYGILWDNNSRTKLGDIRDYKSISSLNLFDNNGNEGGLSAEYFRNSDFTSLHTTRVENKIEHEFLDQNDVFPEGFSENVSAVRWSGKISANISGEYKFRLYSSSYTKMWLDGKLIADSWRQNWLPWTYIPRLYMEAGKKYDIKIEWIHNEGFIGLKYLTPEDELYKNSISLYSEVADQIDYYFIQGGNIDSIISGYREITGKSPMMPKWALGLWQCRERYKTQDELLEVVKEFRKRNIPLDNIVQDWFYWEEDKWGDHEFDSTRFPNPQGMINTLHNELNTNIMISVWPKFYVNTDNYQKFDAKGLLYKRNVEKKERDWVGPGYVSTFYDPYSEEAQELFWQGINEKLFSLGLDAWWLDANEPDIHSNLSRNETRLRLSPTHLGTFAKYLNTYSLMNSKAVYEGQREAAPDKRVFILTRSAFAGQQRYSAATWSGDIAARWHDFKMQIPAGLNFSLSGIPYWTTDIGGFAVEPRYENPNKDDLDEWRELNTRWFQFGAFCPLFRVHGQFPFREMFNIATDNHPAYQSMLKYDKLRYRLMPYIYSLTGMVTHNDYTMMRALVMDFSNDANVYSIGDQYMFGPSLLINPITEYKLREKSVYLPEGNGWFDFHTGKYFNGGQTINAPAPYSDIPIFVKAGAIIPFGPEIQYTAEKANDIITIYVYEGKDGIFSLYEDENINNNYENGKFTIIDITYDDNSKSLTIGDRKGEFEGMLINRKFEVVLVEIGSNKSFNLKVEPDTVINYNGSRILVKLK